MLPLDDAAASIFEVDKSAKTSHAVNTSNRILLVAFEVIFRRRNPLRRFFRLATPIKRIARTKRTTSALQLPQNSESGLALLLTLTTFWIYRQNLIAIPLNQHSNHVVAKRKFAHTEQRIIKKGHVVSDLGTETIFV